MTAPDTSDRGEAPQGDGAQTKKIAPPPEPIAGVRVAESTNRAWTPGHWIAREYEFGEGRWVQRPTFRVWDDADAVCRTVTEHYRNAGVRFEVVRFAPGEISRAELIAERDTLRVIIDGRTTPPTDEEIAAHRRAGGTWVVGARPVFRIKDARELRAVCERRAVLHAETPPGWPPYRWLPFDREGRPCAWPVARGGAQ